MTFGNQIILAILAVIAVSVVTYNSPIFSGNPEKHSIEDFPLVEQPDQITCGPTSALMLLKYYGNDTITLEEVKAKSKTHWFDYGGSPIGMTAPDVLAGALAQLGLPCEMMKGSFSNLHYFISKNRPCIVLVRSGEYTWHYVVAIGYDKKCVTVADPGWGKKRFLDRDDFGGAWEFSTDMNGTVSKDKMVAGILSLAEVHPHTLIVPNEAK
tara:strand:- start:8202 stop:8834 length:633 start_codon:yes stop_codon:yes gene_type:complete